MGAIINGGITQQTYNTLGNATLVYSLSTNSGGPLQDWFRPLRNILINKGQLSDFIDIPLNMSPETPIELELQPSYDDSINMIWVDGVNKDRIVNSRFSVTEERLAVTTERGNNTNTYDINYVDNVTALAKKSSIRMKIDLLDIGFGGVMRAGNYTFYFKYTDEDNNDTNFVGQSGLVSIFNGSLNSNKTVNEIYGGLQNENCKKSVKLKLKNLDPAFSSIRVYVARAYGTKGVKAQTQYYYLPTTFNYKDPKELTITITGNEIIQEVTQYDFNIENIYDTSNTITQCQNILFKGNIVDEGFDTSDNLILEDVACRIFPKPAQSEQIGFIGKDYKDITELPINATINDDGKFYVDNNPTGVGGEYYNPLNIYYRVGYWDEQLYRLGVIFSRKGTLSQVFDIRGGLLDSVRRWAEYSNPQLYEWDSDNNKYKYRIARNLDFLENDKLFLHPSTSTSDYEKYENIGGVSKIIADNPIIGKEMITPLFLQFELGFKDSKNNIDERDHILKILNDLEIDGIYFVRQNTPVDIICQGTVHGFNRQTGTPHVAIETIYQESGNIFPLGYTTYVHECWLSRILNLGNAWQAGVLEGKSIRDASYWASWSGGGYENSPFRMSNFATSEKTDEDEEENKEEDPNYIPGFKSNEGLWRDSTDFNGAKSADIEVYTKYTTENLTNDGYKWLLTNTQDNKWSNTSTLTLINSGNDNTWEIEEPYTESHAWKYWTPSKSTNDIKNWNNGIWAKSPFISKQIIICPDVMLNQEDYSSIFVNNKFNISKSESNFNQNVLYENERIILSENYSNNKNKTKDTKNQNIMFIDSPKTTGSKLMRVTNRIGESSSDLSDALNAYIVAGHLWGPRAIQKKFSTTRWITSPWIASWLARGIFPNYLFIDPTIDDDKSNDYNGRPYHKHYLVNIDENSTLEDRDRILERSNNSNEYIMISDYISIIEPSNSQEKIKWLNSINNISCFRGDCFTSTYAQRMVYNFAGDNLKTIVDPWNFQKVIEYGDNFYQIYKKDTSSQDEAWKKSLITNENLRWESKENGGRSSIANMKQDQVNMADWNGVKMGHWLVTKCLTHSNIGLRSIDESIVGGAVRTFYPYKTVAELLKTDTMESFVYNKAYSKYPIGKVYYNSSSAISNNNNSNRIVYSNVMSKQSLENNYTKFLINHYRDYLYNYGTITKIIEFQSQLIVVFERGVCMIPVNERAIASEAEGNTVYINTSNVLPENPLILSNKIGSTWQESIIKTSRFIYGFDSVSKKIWRTDGKTFEIISEFKVNDFLVNYANVWNSFKTGRTNIKTHYNAFKEDVLFVIYDRTNQDEPIEYNLCYNENLDMWITFYDWMPLASENSGNKFISFDLKKLWKYSTFANRSLEFWKHGTNIRFNGLYDIMPTSWYSTYEGGIISKADYNLDGENISFENRKIYKYSFDFIVNGPAGMQKIFDNLLMISNKTAPESFTFEIVGESYGFSKLKDKIIQIQNLTDSELVAGDTLYNILYPDMFNKGIPYIPIYSSEMTPIQNTNTSQSYIAFYKRLNEYRIRNYQLGLDIKKYGRARGNMEYLEDAWNVEIRPISYAKKYLIGASAGNPTQNVGTTKKIDTKTRDKYLKVRVVYSGEDLSVVYAIHTMFTMSFA